MIAQEQGELDEGGFTADVVEHGQHTDDGNYDDDQGTGSRRSQRQVVRVMGMVPEVAIQPKKGPKAQATSQKAAMLSRNLNLVRSATVAIVIIGFGEEENAKCPEQTVENEKKGEAPTEVADLEGTEKKEVFQEEKDGDEEGGFDGGEQPLDDCAAAGFGGGQGSAKLATICSASGSGRQMGWWIV